MTNEEQLAFYRLQKENIELKGIVLGSQLKIVEQNIEALTKAQNEQLAI